MPSIFKFAMIHNVEEEVLRFIGAFLVIVIAALTRKQCQKSPLWHWCINMAFWQCFIPALIMELQDQASSEVIGPVEMAFAIAIGVTLSTLFGIRTVVNSLPTEDFIAMIKSMDDSPKIIIRRKENVKINKDEPVKADVLIADDEPVVLVSATNDLNVPIIREVRKGGLLPLKPILKKPGSQDFNFANKSPSKKLKGFFNKKVKI